MEVLVTFNFFFSAINTLTEITRPTPTSAHVIYRPTPRQAAQDGAGWFVVQYDVETAEAGELLVCLCSIILSLTSSAHR